MRNRLPVAIFNKVGIPRGRATRVGMNLPVCCHQRGNVRCLSLMNPGRNIPAVRRCTFDRTRHDATDVRSKACHHDFSALYSVLYSEAPLIADGVSNCGLGNHRNHRRLARLSYHAKLALPRNGF